MMMVCLFFIIFFCGVFGVNCGLGYLVDGNGEFVRDDMGEVVRLGEDEVEM
jgi:hypothetical protein